MKYEGDIQYSYQIKQSTFCKYVLIAPNKAVELNFPQMLELRRKINGLTTYNALSEILNSHNFVLLFVADRQHLIYLDIPQLLKLKEEIASFFQDFNTVSA
ncbi:hypothetical protein VOI54_06380 [Tamlana sp. 2201CG12-4]|uniref:hypothetical protein n=1 Tax=Tamlana sp. 2201CG12-4 TaxID=3112582 RepID=UPI002DB7D02A|nr:hypothetical protein [Tamlana sp. 2201CG12-4]MEC3906638.1 hypothetical protein [Tamlana sp. 2201CG12-4]